MTQSFYSKYVGKRIWNQIYTAGRKDYIDTVLTSMTNNVDDTVSEY